MLNTKICQAIDSQKATLINLSHEIHEHPELCFTEHTAVNLIQAILIKNGFQFTCPWAGLDTAFKAEYQGKPGGKTVAFLAEYDALAKVGHGCGHNLIATMAVGAALGLKSVLENVAGKVVVLGCPGEEGGNGKIIMLENNGFDGVDYAMMIHPADHNLIQRGGLASVLVTVEYVGKAAHSKDPSKGINALTALITLFNSIDARRQCWPATARCNGIITEGGTAPNIVPDYAKAQFTLRAATIAELSLVADDVARLAQAAEMMTGAKVKFTRALATSERYCNLAMDLRLKEHAAELGVTMQLPPKNYAIGSSDFGNVSMQLPGIHAYLSIAEPGEKIIGHTDEMCKRAISAKADEVAVIGAKSLAMTGYDILTDEKLQAAIAEEFKKVPKK